MAPADAAPREDVWGQLQQPVRLSGTEPRLRLLLAALDRGWQVEEPVYLRPRWSDSGTRVYHFILRQPGGVRLVTVPESEAVEQFVHAEGFRVAL